MATATPRATIAGVDMQQSALALEAPGGAVNVDGAAAVAGASAAGDRTLCEPLEKCRSKDLRREAYRLKLRIVRKGPDTNDHKEGYIALLREYRRGLAQGECADPLGTTTTSTTMTTQKKTSTVVPPRDGEHVTLVTGPRKTQSSQTKQQAPCVSPVFVSPPPPSPQRAPPGLFFFPRQQQMKETQMMDPTADQRVDEAHSSLTVVRSPSSPTLRGLQPGSEEGALSLASLIEETDEADEQGSEGAESPTITLNRGAASLLGKPTNTTEAPTHVGLPVKIVQYQSQAEMEVMIKHTEYWEKRLAISKRKIHQLHEELETRKDDEEIGLLQHELKYYFQERKRALRSLLEDSKLG